MHPEKQTDRLFEQRQHKRHRRNQEVLYVIRTKLGEIVDMAKEQKTQENNKRNLTPLICPLPTENLYPSAGLCVDIFAESKIWMCSDIPVKLQKCCCLLCW